MSYPFSLIIFLLSFFFLLFSCYYSYINYENYDKDKVLFYEFFVDLDDSPEARLFTPLLLIRRFLFVVIIISLSESNTGLLFTLLIIIQLIYFFHTVLVKKYKDIGMILAHIINELILTEYILIMGANTKMRHWDELMRLSTNYLVTINTVIVTLLILVFLLLIFH